MLKFCFKNSSLGLQRQHLLSSIRFRVWTPSFHIKMCKCCVSSFLVLRSLRQGTPAARWRVSLPVISEIQTQQRHPASVNEMDSGGENPLASALGLCIHVLTFVTTCIHVSTHSHMHTHTYIEFQLMF